MGAVTRSGRIASEFVNHALAQTDLDDRLVSVVSEKLEQAKSFADTTRGQIASMDYVEYTKIPAALYDTHLAAHVDKCQKVAEPYLNQHFHPNVEKAKVSLAPHMDTAKAHFDTVMSRVHGDVLPAVQNAFAKAPEHVNAARKSVDANLDSLVETITRASPELRRTIPTHAFDRLCLMLVVLIAVYVSLIVFRRVLRVVYGTVRLVARLAWTLFGMVTSWAFFFGTGFYCCCLCRRRGSPGSSKKQEAAVAKAVTAKELVALLESAKKEKKLQPAVQQLVKSCKNGKALSSPKHLDGKIVCKDILKDALGKFKEIDIKKVGL
jgi:hypothetical protein